MLPAPSTVAPAPPRDGRCWSRTAVAVSLALGAGALLVRLLARPGRPLWFDECVSVLVARLEPRLLVEQATGHSINGGLHGVLLAGVLRVTDPLGVDVLVAARGLSVALGVLAVLAAWAHLFAAFVLPAQALAAALHPRSRPALAWLGAGFALAGIDTAAVVLQGARQDASQVAWIGSPSSSRSAWRRCGALARSPRPPWSSARSRSGRWCATTGRSPRGSPSTGWRRASCGSPGPATRWS